MMLITIPLYVKDWLNFGHLHTKRSKNHNQIYVQVRLSLVAYQHIQRLNDFANHILYNNTNIPLLTTLLVERKLMFED